MTSRVLPIGIIFDLCIPIGGYTHHQEDSYPDSKQFKPERFFRTAIFSYGVCTMKEREKREKSGRFGKSALVEIVRLH